MHVLFYSDLQSHQLVVYALLYFNPATRNLFDIITSSGYQFNHPRTQRYVALLLIPDLFQLPDRAYIIEFETLEFLQGLITAYNWESNDYHNRIPVVYDGDRPMTIV